MVEKVAKAIYEKAVQQRPLTPLGMCVEIPTWEEASESDKAFARGEARAAIEAMREPTVAMHKAGTIRDDGADPTNAKGVYSVMIDAALKEGGK